MKCFGHLCGITLNCFQTLEFYVERCSNCSSSQQGVQTYPSVIVHIKGCGIYHKYLDTLSQHHIYPWIWSSTGSLLFAQACLFKYWGWLQYTNIAWNSHNWFKLPSSSLKSVFIFQCMWVVQQWELLPGGSWSMKKDPNSTTINWYGCLLLRCHP